MSIVEQMVEHAATSPNKEVCGLVVNGKKKSYTLRGVNVAENPYIHFDMDPDIWLLVPDEDQVVATYHSHPSGNTTPTIADLVACEATTMPMYIVSPGGSFNIVEPSGYQAPYLNRPYVHGVLDCYSIVRDWYSREFEIPLEDYPRDHGWWYKGQNLYLDNFEKAGFVEVSGMPVQHGDVFLLQVRSEVPNHAVIWQTGGTILHHIQDRVSRVDQWTGYWAHHAVNHLRHKSRMK